MAYCGLLWYDVGRLETKEKRMNCPKCGFKMFVWRRFLKPWKASCLKCFYRYEFVPELEPSTVEIEIPSCLAPEDTR